MTALTSDDVDLQASQTAEHFARRLSDDGFIDVKVAPAQLPEHICALLRQVPEAADLPLDRLCAGLQYYRVESLQGSFGIFIGDTLEIDLTGSGVEYRDVHPDAASADGSYPLIISDHLTAFVEFRVFLESKHRASSL